MGEYSYPFRQVQLLAFLCHSTVLYFSVIIRWDKGADGPLAVSHCLVTTDRDSGFWCRRKMGHPLIRQISLNISTWETLIRKGRGSCEIKEKLLHFTYRSKLLVWMPQEQGICFSRVTSPVWSGICTRWISSLGVMSAQRGNLGPARWGQMGHMGQGKIMYWLQFQLQIPGFSVISSVILCILLKFFAPPSPFLKKWG